MNEAPHRVYFDHAATTPLDRRVLEAMLPAYQGVWGNPSSIYAEGREARRALDGARKTIADILGAKPNDIIFTSGGSESDNLAIRGAAYASTRRGRHIVTSAIEHHAVLHTVEQLEHEGFEATYLPVDGEGFVSPDDLARALRPDTTVVSVMYANNEVGTIEPIAELARVTKAFDRHIVFHTDAVQAAGALDLNVDALGVDMLSLTAHKLYGPKGSGALYVRPLRDELWAGLSSQIPGLRLTGASDFDKRLANNLSFCVNGVEGEAVLIQMDLNGISASSGSACTTGSLEPSHVLTAMGLPSHVARGSLRLTLGKDNTQEDVQRLIAILPPAIEKLRRLAPLATPTS